MTACLFATPAAAVCMRPVHKACSLYFKSDAVFVANVVGRRLVEDSNYERFDLRVSQVLRGSVQRSSPVFVGNDTGRLFWEPGKTYVVFARRVNGRLEATDGCGLLSDPGKVPDFLQQIRVVQRSRLSVIEGEILQRPPEGPGLEGVEVRAVGASREYRGKSDKKGYFRIQVPPGRYDVIVDPAVAVPSGYNWGDVSGFELQRGQCMQIQFGAR